MATRGKKAKSPALHLATGTDQPCRRKEQVVVPLHGEVQRPKWLTGAARKIWERKTEIYERRGQNIVGMEDTLAHYCALEAHLRQQWKSPAGPTMAEINAYRIFAETFFDTPASQLTRPKGKPPDNPFSKHAR